MHTSHHSAPIYRLEMSPAAAPAAPPAPPAAQAPAAGPPPLPRWALAAALAILEGAPVVVAGVDAPPGARGQT